MAYSKQTWVDRTVENPLTFNMTTNPDTTITLTPAPGNVTTEGTLITATRMNHIEDGIEANSNGIVAANAAISQTNQTVQSLATAFNGKFTVLTGTMTGDGTESLSINIAFPSGFNNTNCVVIASMLQNINTQNGSWGCGSCFNSSSYVSGALPHRTYINTSGVHIDARNILILNDTTPSVLTFSTNVKFNYKIVLMKIS